MARDVFKFAPSIPAGTLLSAPVKIAMVFPPREVREIEIIVPPGPRGQMGFQIGQAGAQVIPANSGAWIVTDNETIRWPLEDANTSGAWQLIGYNTGVWPHSLEVRFLCDLPGEGQTAAIPDPLNPAVLSSA